MPPTDEAAKSHRPAAADPQPVEAPLTIKDLTAVLVRHYGLNRGRFDILIEFQIGVGSVGPSPDARVPTAMVGVSKVGLTEAKGADSPTTVDAAVVNPAPKRR